jgi:hypothetical protein
LVVSFEQLSLLCFERPTHIWTFSLMGFRVSKKNCDVFSQAHLFLTENVLLFLFRVTDNSTNNIKIIVY